MSQLVGPILLATTLITAASSMALAQAPSCNSAQLGTVACFVRKLCACTLSRGGAMTGQPAGYRWDCGPLRPGCGADTALPATIVSFVVWLAVACGLLAALGGPA